MDCEKVVRLGFIRKVYGILSMQLLATSFVCCLAMTMTGEYVGSFPILSLGSFIVASTAFHWIVFVFTIVVLIALFCYRHSYPINYILLTVWTIAISFSVASACVVVLCDPMVQQRNGVVLPLSYSNASDSGTQLYRGSVLCAVGTARAQSGTNNVLMAVGITASIFLGLTAFTFQSRWDFSYLGAGLGTTLWILIIWGICMSIFGGGELMRYLYRQVFL